MPTIDTPLLLDLLLGLVILLFVPFGIRRGAAKEAMVSAGILFGALVASTWADRGGAELVSRFGVDPRIAPFVVAMAALFGGVFIIGYGGGAALGRLPQGWMSHLVGGLLAVLNGGLLLSYLLIFLDEYLPAPRALNDGVVADFLVDRFDLLQLAVGGGLIILVLLGIVVSTVRNQNQPRPAGTVSVARNRPVRVASDADSGKFEPDLPGPGGTAPVSTLDQTAPLLERPRRPWDEVSRSGNGHQQWAADPATNTQSAPYSAGNELWERRSPAPSWSAGGDASTSTGQPTFGQPVAGDPNPSRCANCGAAIGPRDLFCPSCGKTV